MSLKSAAQLKLGLFGTLDGVILVFVLFGSRENREIERRVKDCKNQRCQGNHSIERYQHLLAFRVVGFNFGLTLHLGRGRKVHPA